MEPSTKPGPAPAPIDLDQVETLAGMGCTLDEIAAFFKLSKRTLIRREKEPKFLEAIERGRANGRVSLRRMQWNAANGGNVTAQIWLGKQLLGQRSFEKPEPEAPQAKPTAVTYQWIPRKSEEPSNTPLSPPSRGSTTP